MNHGRLVTAGLMSDVMKTGMDTSRLIIELRTAPDQIVQMISEYPGVRVESVKENQIIISGVQDDIMVNRIIFDILSKGIVIGGFRREEHSLENIFMKITEEADAERRNAYDQTVQQPNN